MEKLALVKISLNLSIYFRKQDDSTSEPAFALKCREAVTKQFLQNS